MSLRNRLTWVVAAGTLVLVCALIGGFNIVLRHEIRGDLDGQLRDRASAALANVVVTNGTVRVREAPGDEAIDQQVWVFAHGSKVEAPHGTPAVDAAARSAAQRPHRFLTAGELDVRLYAAPLRADRQAIGAVVAGRSLAPYETTVRRALVASIVLGLALLAAMLAAIRLAIGA